MSVEIIQIIEDDPTHAALLDHALRKARYRTNITHEGLRGLDETKRLKPSLVLIDVMLPGLDGHELCRRLRHDPQTRMIPIMIVTALGSQDDRIRAYELGVDDYVTKPFSTREVVLRVKAVLRRGQLGHVRERYWCWKTAFTSSRFEAGGSHCPDLNGGSFAGWRGILGRS